MSISFRKKFNAWRKKAASKRVVKNPFFYFGSLAVVFLAMLSFGTASLAELNTFGNVNTVAATSFLHANNDQNTSDLFFAKEDQSVRETPDLKLIQDNFVAGITTHDALTTQTLGAIMGGQESQNRKDVVDYAVQPGDTVESVAQYFGISTNTIAWANDISKSSALKVGQNLVILPVSGLIHVVKNGDTISDIAKTYKAKTQDIIEFNGLTGEGDIFIGDILIIPDGVKPAKVISNGQTPLPSSFFIYPAEGSISQGLHYYNGVDVANKCGTPVYATAAGTVQRAVGNGGWNFGMGNHVTILHVNGVSTYYGHLMSLFVKPGDQVNVGDRIGLMGKTGKATGCHVHFQVLGGANPLAKYLVGTKLNYK